MMKKTLALLCAIMLIVSSFAACSGKDGSDADFVVPIESEPRSLDPQIAADAVSDIVITNCFEGLVRINEHGEVAPCNRTRLCVWLAQGGDAADGFPLRILIVHDKKCEASE